MVKWCGIGCCGKREKSWVDSMQNIKSNLNERMDVITLETTRYARDRVGGKTWRKARREVMNEVFDKVRWEVWDRLLLVTRKKLG